MIRARLEELLAELAPIGRDPDTGGYRRYAGTEADIECRAWFARTVESMGLELTTDPNGNLFTFHPSPLPGERVVLTGSHLDSVPDGGAFDGPLGVVSGLLALESLRASGHTPSKPIGVGVFADEEGARFGVACVGSRLMTGALTPERARSLSDATGFTLPDALRAIGVDPDGIGPDRDRLAQIEAFVELHIEQGRALADVDAAVGIGTAIWPHGRWRIDLSGEANHAGTTRLEDRHDPMLGLAGVVSAAREAARSNGALATVGKVSVEPNATNAVPSGVSCWLDARAPSLESLELVVGEVRAAASAASAAHGLEVSMREESLSPAVDLDASLRDRIASVLPGAPHISTGAGHDAGILGGRVPTAMLFVRNPTGVSHSPAESAPIEDCVAGVEALTAVLAHLTSEG